METSGGGVPPSRIPWKPVGAQASEVQGSDQLRSNAWIWIVAIVAVVVVIAGLIAIGVAFRATEHSKLEANGLVGVLHQRMATKDWNGIYETTSPEYRKVTTAERNQALFVRIDQKMGAPVSTTQTSIRASTDTNGTYLTGIFRTKFAGNVTGVETVVWTKVDGQYRMRRYYINSSALVKR